MPRADGGRRRFQEILSILHREKVARGLTPEKLIRLLTALGPTYVKIGQILSMREDLLPPDYIQALMALQQNVDPMPFPVVREVLAAELGDGRLLEFDRIDETPLGSASMAQAHRAHLSDGSDVVVKVQRPHIDQMMAEDIKLLRRAASVMNAVSSIRGAVDLSRLIDEIERTTEQELNFLTEARHLDRFAQYHAGIKYTGCPKVLWRMTTRRVLTMEFIEGVPVSDRQALEACGYDLSDIGRKLAESFTKQVLDDGYFHADPHPGNVFIRGGQIVWMDMGMMGEISPREQRLMKKALMGMLHGDVGSVKEVVLTMGEVHGPVDHSRLFDDIDLTIMRYADLPLQEMNLAVLLRELLTMARNHQIVMPASMSMLVRGLMTVEGTLERLSPDISLVNVMRAHLSASLLDHLDIDKEVRQTAEALLYSGKQIVRLPGKLTELTEMLIKGQGKLNLDLTGSEKPLNSIRKMIDRLALSLVAAALIIGAALTADAPAGPMPFAIPAFFVVVWLIICILREHRPR